MKLLLKHLIIVRDSYKKLIFRKSKKKIPSFQEPSLEERQNGVEIKEPLDTIFVKSVRPNGPAHLAGLQCGKSFISPRK